MKDHATCFNSLTLLVLKEIRLEKGIQSAQIAEQTGRSPSTWAKIETGKSAFPMDSLFQASRALWTPPSAVIATAERYAAFLGQSSWAVLNSPLSAEEDDLLQIAQRYYESPGFKRRFQPAFGHVGFNGFGLSILNSPIFYPDGSVQIVDVFRFALDEEFRKTQEV